MHCYDTDTYMCAEVLSSKQLGANSDCLKWKELIGSILGASRINQKPRQPAGLKQDQKGPVTYK